MNRPFDADKIKKLDLKELHGKTLTITVIENEEAVLIVGQDIYNKDVYVLSYTDKPKQKGVIR